MEPMLLSGIEWCPLYGGVILCHIVFWDENNFPLFRGARCIDNKVTLYRGVR